MRFRLFPDPPAPLGSESWRKVAWPAIKRSAAWYFYLGVAVAMLTPKALVSQSLAVQSVIEFVAGLVPALSKFVAISDFPEVTGFYFAVMWLLLPIPTLLVALRWPPPPAPTFKHIIKLVVLGPASIVIILAVLFILPIQEDFVASYRHGQGIAFLTLMSQYRVGLGGLGSIVFATLAGIIGAWSKFVWVTVAKLVGVSRANQ